MKNDKVSLSGMDDTEAIPVSISTDVIAMMTINDTLSKTEELKKQTEVRSKKLDKEVLCDIWN